MISPAHDNNVITKLELSELGQLVKEFLGNSNSYAAFEGRVRAFFCVIFEKVWNRAPNTAICVN